MARHRDRIAWPAPRHKRKAPIRVSNTRKATTAGALGGAAAAWLAFEVQRRYGVPVEVAGEILSIVTGAITGLIARWASKLEPSE